MNDPTRGDEYLCSVCGCTFRCPSGQPEEVNGEVVCPECWEPPLTWWELRQMMPIE